MFTRFFREFNSTDSAYIEDQHYNYTVMLQNTNTYEEYTLRNSEGQSISFSPDPSYRLGALSRLAMGVSGLYVRPEAH